MNVPHYFVQKEEIQNNQLDVFILNKPHFYVALFNFHTVCVSIYFNLKYGFRPLNNSDPASRKTT